MPSNMPTLYLLLSCLTQVSSKVEGSRVCYSHLRPGCEPGRCTVVVKSSCNLLRAVRYGKVSLKTLLPVLVYTFCGNWNSELSRDGFIFQRCVEY